MLVLTRKLGEAVKVGDDIVVTVSQIKGKKIRLAIQAPEDLKILRAELDEEDKQ